MQVELDDKTVAELIAAGLNARQAAPSSAAPEIAIGGSKVKILVLQRAWILVGKHHMEGEYHVLTDASVIRVWGTTKGLGELAENGPLATTKLDPVAKPVRAHYLTTVMTIDVEDSKWAK